MTELIQGIIIRGDEITLRNNRTERATWPYCDNMIKQQLASLGQKGTTQPRHSVFRTTPARGHQHLPPFPPYSSTTGHDGLSHDGDGKVRNFMPLH